MVKKILFIGIITTTIISAGCTIKPKYACYSEMPYPQPIFNVSPINSKIDLVNAIDGDYTIGDTIFLYVRNITDEYVILPGDYNGFIERVEGQKIFEVLIDNFDKSNEGPIILGPVGIDGSIAGLIFMPEISNRGVPETIGISVRGNVYKDGQICTDSYAGKIMMSILP